MLLINTLYSGPEEKNSIKNNNFKSTANKKWSYVAVHLKEFKCMN